MSRAANLRMSAVVRAKGGTRGSREDVDDFAVDGVGKSAAAGNPGT